MGVGTSPERPPSLRTAAQPKRPGPHTEPDPLITPERAAAGLALLLVVAIALGGFLYERRGDEIGRLEQEKRALVLERERTAGVVKALAEVRAEARAAAARLQRTIASQQRALEATEARLAAAEAGSATAGSDLAQTKARLAKSQAQLRASRKALEAAQAQLAAAEKAAAAGTATAPATTTPATALTAEEQQTKRFCDALGALWWQYPGCRAFYREH